MASCGNSDGEGKAVATTAPPATAAQVAAAESVVRAYLTALNEGRYGEAATMYGGSYGMRGSASGLAVLDLPPYTP